MTQALRHNFTLTTLDVAGNEIPSEVQEAIGPVSLFILVLIFVETAVLRNREIYYTQCQHADDTEKLMHDLQSMQQQMKSQEVCFSISVYLITYRTSFY